MGVNLGIKTKFIPLDLYLGLVDHLDYHLLKLGSLEQFRIATGYQAAIKWYSDNIYLGLEINFVWKGLYV